MIAIFSLFRAFWPYIAGAIAVALLYGYVHHQGVLSERKNTDKAKADAAAARGELADYKKQQQAYAAKLVLDWQTAVDTATKAQKDKEDALKQKFTGQSDAIRRNPLLRSIAIPADAGRVFDETAAALASTAGPAAVAADATPAVSAADYAAIIADNAQAYAACYSRWQGWVQFYAAVRAAQPKE